MGAQLLYIANARLPTEKAHGHAIVKMCEAYARLGLDVELWHPRRRQGDPRLEAASVFEFYDVAPVFRVRSIANIDVIPAQTWCPPRLFPWLVAAHDTFWAWYAAQLARRGQPALCHTRDPATAFWLSRARVPTILEVHDPPAGPRRSFIRQAASTPYVRGVIALTEACRDELILLGVEESKITVLGSCVDVEPYARVPSRSDCRRLHGLPLDRQIVGYVGRFEALGKQKGLPTLVEAIAILHRDLDVTPTLLCVGGPMASVPAYLEAGRAAGIAPEDLRFVDHVPSGDVPAWISACDVGVVPSPSSDHLARFSSPMKVFEFMAAGVPLVASDLPAIREVLTNNDNGWLVEADDPAALARGLLQILTDHDLAERVGSQAKHDVGQHTWAKRAQTIVARYGAYETTLP